MIAKFNKWLFTPVDNTPLVLFRVLFGFLLFAEAFGALVSGWVYRLFVQTKYTIPFLGFDWLATLLHGPIMYIWYGILALLGLMVMVGKKYKISLALYWIMWWSVYLIQKSHYNNHYYLMVVLCLVMLLLPAHRYFSFDAQKPQNRSYSCPRWVYFLLISFFSIVYFYASINKIYPDWLNAIPISLWFSQKSDYWLIGPLLSQSWMPWLISYGGIVFDFFIIPALLWRKTRTIAFFLNIFFHLFNSAVFQIGVFPYLMIAISVLFFPAEQLRNWFLKTKPKLSEPITEYYKTKPVYVWVIMLFLLANVLMPLRQYLFEGSVFYTEEGHRMSWRMMLRAKGGSINFTVINKDTKESEVVNMLDYLSKSQISTIATHPDAAYWFVQKLKVWYAQKGWPNIIINASCRIKVNSQNYYNQYDANLDLATVEWSHFTHNDWVLYPEKE